MLVALLAVLGVDLAGVLVMLAIAVLRRRWVKRRPGSFAGAVRVTGGTAENVPPTWRRGYGRWVGPVLAWTTRPFLLRNVLVAVETAERLRAAEAGEVKHLGKAPVVVTFEAAGGGRLEIATLHDRASLALGPFARPAACTEQREPAAVG